MLLKLIANHVSRASKSNNMRSIYKNKCSDWSMDVPRLLSARKVQLFESIDRIRKNLRLFANVAIRKNKDKYSRKVEF